jgi:hypothetical protein
LAAGDKYTLVNTAEHWKRINSKKFQVVKFQVSRSESWNDHGLWLDVSSCGSQEPVGLRLNKDGEAKSKGA